MKTVIDMMTGLIFKILVFCIIITSLGYSVIISKEVQEYLNEVLDKYCAGSIPKDFHEIVPQRLPIQEWPSPHVFTRPNIFIWDPSNQYEDIFSVKPLLCHLHDQPLKGGHWSDGSTNSLNPRLILTNDGPALLIFKGYYCSSDESRHYVRSTDAVFLSHISSIGIEIPFLLTYKSGCTLAFVRRIRELAGNGVSFNLIQALYIENQLQKVTESKHSFLKHCELHQTLVCKTPLIEYTTDCIEKAFEDYVNFLINLCPSDDFLGDIFLKDFSERKELYEKSMCGITATALMADHTFKVTINIGVNRESDNAWVKQFNSLFVVLNEKHEVVTWKLTRKEQFDFVKDILENLHERIAAKGENIKYFMIDNCCKWRGKIQNVFGSDTIVLLDLFHAVQRITKTLKKKHAFYSNCVNDLSLVFRTLDDRGQKRTKATVDSSAMLTNIERFREKWVQIDQTGKDSLLKESFNNQIDNLKEHISNGCLSNIPVGYSTSINECLHEKINDLFAGAKMGPELAIALLTVFFYSWNSRKNNRVKGIPIVRPLEVCSSSTGDRKERLGLGFEGKAESATSTVMSQSETNAEPTCDGLLARAISMLSFFQSMKVKSNKRNQMSIYQLFFDGEILSFMLKPMGVSGTDKGLMAKERIEKPVQNDIAATFGMKVVEVPRDGNCLFTSVAMAISQEFEISTETSSMIEHLNSLGLLTKDVENLAPRLRSVMVDELLQHKDRYSTFLSDENNANYEEIVQRLKNTGSFSGDAGDLMVKSLSNILQVPIVLITSIQNFPIITVTPEKFQETTFRIYLSFEREGPGHYNAILLQQSANDKLGKKEVHCSCGYSNLKNGKSACSSSYSEEYQRNYSSRCPCLRSKNNCNESCKCKGCANPFGSRPVIAKSVNKRKRNTHEFTNKRMSGVEYLLAEEAGVEGGKWTEEENAILLQLLLEQPDILTAEHKEPKEMELLTEKFNTCVELASKERLGIKHLRVKSSLAIEQKIRHLKKQKELLYLYLDEQLKTFVTELS